MENAGIKKERGALGESKTGIEIFKRLQDGKVGYLDTNRKFVELGGGDISEEALREALGKGEGAVCNITMTPQTVELGPLVNFYFPGGFGTPDVIIPGALEMSRNDDSTIFNSVLEFNSFSNFPNSPLNTEWNADGWGTLEDIKSRDYSTFWDVTNDGFNYLPLGKELIMHDLDSDRYWKIEFTVWTIGPRTGEWGWNREEITVSDPCVFTFSDGSTMETAPVTPTDANTWDIAKVAFVDPVNGNDSEAVVGNGNKPYRNVFTAFANSNYVWLNPGIYSGTITPPNETSYLHAPTGVIFGNGCRIQDTTNNSKEFYLTGSAIFGDFSYGVYNTGNATMNIECDKFHNVRTFTFNTGTGITNITCNSALVNCFNGGGYGITARSTSKTNINVKHFYHSQHIISTFFQLANGGEFYFTCPDTRLIPNYTASYGTAAKSFFESESATGGKVVINTNLTNTDPTTPTSNGMIQASNNAVAPGIHFTFKGNIDAGVARCFRPYYRAAFGQYFFEGDMIAGTSPVYSAITGWSGLALLTAHFKNGTLSGASNVIGRGKEFSFSNCMIEHSSGGSPFASNLGGNGSADPVLYIYNSSMYSSAAGTGITFSGFGGTSVIGCVNTTSTEPYGATNPDVFTPSGFVQINGLVIPKF